MKTWTLTFSFPAESLLYYLKKNNWNERFLGYNTIFSVLPEGILLLELESTHIISAVCLCMKAMRSAALPVPSHTTTGTAGFSFRYSHTVRISFGPPSTSSPTKGTPCPIPISKQAEAVTSNTKHTSSDSCHCPHQGKKDKRGKKSVIRLFLVRKN